MSRYGKLKMILHISKFVLIIVLSAVCKVKLSRLSMANLRGNVNKRSETKAKNRLWPTNAVISTSLYHVYNTVRQYFELYRPFDEKLDRPTDRKPPDVGFKNTRLNINFMCTN